MDEWIGYLDCNRLRLEKKKRWYLVVRHLLRKDNCYFICYNKKQLVKHRERFTTDIREVWEKSIFNFKIKQLLTQEKAKKKLNEKSIILPYLIDFKMPLIVKCIIFLRRKKKLLPIEKASCKL